MANPGSGMASAMAILVATTMIWGTAMSQSNGTDCTNVIISMSPCLNYIQGKNSTTSTTPGSGCCTQLQTVVNSQPQCLCQVLNGGGSSLGLTIDQTQALMLPRACGVQTPPASQCNSTLTPGSSSTVSSSGRGSTTTTSSATGKPSDATSIKITAPLFFFLVFVASYVSTSS